MLTLITDASCGGPGCAGWGAWAKADGFESSFDGGVVAYGISCAQEAELASMVYGLHMAVAYAPGNDVLLQNDCMHALRQVRYRLGWPESQHRDGARIGDLPMQRCSVNERNLLDELSRVAGSAGVLVTVRHVKGHVPGAKGRHWVNERCDAIAKGHMRYARRRLGVLGV